MAVTFLVSKCAYLNSQRLYRPISRTFSPVTFGAFMTLESRKKSSRQCGLGIFRINQGPNSHEPDTHSTWTAHPSRLLGCAVPCLPLASFAESSWDVGCKSTPADKKAQKKCQSSVGSYFCCKRWMIVTKRLNFPKKFCSCTCFTLYVFRYIREH